MQWPSPDQTNTQLQISPAARQTHIWLEAALSLTQIIPKEGKDDYIKSASTKKSTSETTLSCKTEPERHM